MAEAATNEAATHIVVGDGAVAAGFARGAPVAAGDRLIVIGPEVARLGRGLAYRDHAPGDPWRYAYLLNSPNEVFGAAFVAWFEARWPALAETLRSAQPHWLEFGATHLEARDFGALFAPRAVFGDWIEETTRCALDGFAERGVRLELKAAAATSIERIENGFSVTLSTGETMLADRIDVATGGSANRRFGPEDVGLCAFPALYGFEAELAEAARRGTPVTCVGGNAAMLDVLRLLQSVLREEDLRLRVIRRGGSPEPLMLTRPRQPAAQPMIEGPFTNAEAFLGAIRAEMARLRAGGARMSALRTGFRAWMAETGFGRLLPEAAERRRAARPLENMFRRGTHDSLADYARLRAAGQIEEIVGEVAAIRARKQGGAEIEMRANGAAAKIDADIVVNTSGPGGGLALDPCATQLVEKKWLRKDPRGDGVVVGERLETEIDGLRYLSPAVTEIGAEILAFPLYDVSDLWRRIEAASPRSA